MTKKTDKKQIWTGVAVGAALLILLAVFGIFYKGGAGAAIHIGGEPYLGQSLDLMKELSITITELPEEPLTLSILAGPSIVRAEFLPYELTISKVDDLTYSVDVVQEGNPMASESLIEGDKVQIYLDWDDAIADMEVAFENGQMIISTLHSIPPDSSEITMLDEAGENMYLPIIQVAESEELVGIIVAKSSLPPDLSIQMVPPQSNVNFFQAEQEQDFEKNTTVMALQWVAPEEAGTVTMEVIANVQGQETHAYYTFAVGSVAYSLAETGFPNIAVLKDESGPAFLDITLKATNEMQPLALPCEVDATVLLAHENIKHIYGYAASEELPERANPSLLVPGTLDAMDLFEGYFVELANPQETVISVPCSIESFLPVSAAVPQLTPPGRITLEKGWNLVSLPGIVARPLSDFAEDAEFTINECSEGYECKQLADDTLTPGKPYWVYTEKPVNLNYVRQEYAVGGNTVPVPLEEQGGSVAVPALARREAEASDSEEEVDIDEEEDGLGEGDFDEE